MFLIEVGGETIPFQSANAATDYLRRNHGFSVSTTIRLANALLALKGGKIIVNGRRAILEEPQE